MITHLAITAAVLTPGIAAWFAAKGTPAASSARNWAVVELDPDLA